jgi:hypothetical protein
MQLEHNIMVPYDMYKKFTKQTIKEEKKMTKQTNIKKECNPRHIKTNNTKLKNYYHKQNTRLKV